METLYRIDGCRGGGAAVVSLAGPGEVEALLALLEGVAREQGWRPGDLLRVHAADALHLAVTAAGGLAGGLQAVRGRPGEPLPFRALWPEVTVEDPARTVHVTVLALRPECRGRAGLFWPLCVELWRWCDREGVTEIYLEATPATLAVYRRLGWPPSARRRARRPRRAASCAWSGWGHWPWAPWPS